MARTTVPVRRVNRQDLTTFSTLDVAAGNTVDGMRMVNNGGTVLVVNNGAGSDQTITLTIVETVDFSPAAPVVVTVPSATFFGMIGPFPEEFYGNVLEFDVSSGSLDFAAFSLL